MIHVISAISYENDLLPHFVEHYLSLGVESFIISINELEPGIWERTAALAETLPARITLVPASERQRQTRMAGNNKEETRRGFVKAEDWMIPADLDEFVQFPAPLPALLDEMAEADATFIMGQFSDRLTRDGTLARVAQTPSIWEQYPLEAPISELLVQCWCHKVILCRGDCELTSGHHNVIRPTVPLLARRGVIHHFKWRAGLAEALEKRPSVSGEESRTNSYLREHGRIVPEQFEAKEGWNPHVVPVESKYVIYTAITGGYDLLKDPPFPMQKESDLVIFTDVAQPSRCWKARKIHAEFDDPCRNAKIHKILPHLYFPAAQYSLWIDGSVWVKTPIPLAELAEKYLKDADIAVFRHRVRSSIFEEAEACLAARKDDPDKIRRQMMCYRYESYPAGLGLVECSVILRRHTERVRHFNEIWWNEIKAHSRRDQLSFNYVAWKLRLPYAYFPGTLFQNDLFELHVHQQKSALNLERASREAMPFPASSTESPGHQALEDFRRFRRLSRHSEPG